MARILSRVNGIHLVVGYPLRRAEGLCNAAGVWRDGEVIAEYAKHLLPNYSVFDEKRYFVPGHEAVTFELNGVP